MASDREEKIRSRAYTIWQREGGPEGRGEEHWAQAEREIDNEEAAGGDASRGARVTTSDDPTRSAAPSGGASGFSGAQSGAGGSSAGGPGSTSAAGGSRPAQTAPAGASGVSSGLQPGGAKPGGGPAASQGSIGTGGGSTAGRASGSAADRKQ